MKKLNIGKRLAIFKSHQFVLNSLLILLFAVLFTGILVSKYFFIQNIVDSENKSKVTVIASKNIEVTDNIKTEKRKREVAQKVKPIYTPADNVYIENNLKEIITEVKRIKQDKTSKKEKQKSLETLIDISDSSYIKHYAVTYFLNSNEETLNKLFSKAENALSSVLSEGITEQDIEESSLEAIIKRNVDSSVTANQLKVLTILFEQVIVPNMILNEEATELAKKNAREMVKPIKVQYHKGDIIVKEGEPVTQVKKEALSQVGYNILRINYLGILGIFCLVCLGIFAVFYYIKFFEPKFLNKRHIFIVCSLSIFVSILAILLPSSWSVFLLPFPFFSMIISVFLNPRTSYFITVALLTIITLSLQFSALDMSVFIVSAAVSTIWMTTIKYSRRFDLIKVGCYTSLAMALIIVCVYHDLGYFALIKDLTAGLLNGFIAGVFAVGMIPILENIYKVITMFGLAELGDHNQPLLKKLQETAPGTFEHSTRVSNLAESAAEAIGANPILARVGALYHDIGKIKRPLFFVENQTYSGIENPHEKLPPSSSKMIITSHTKDGLALAKEHHLPEILQDFIIEHHGDSLASYFYNQAVAQEGAENVKEEQFRYTGPRPSSKETAILMIADAVESASRTLKDHSQEELEVLINKIIQDRLNDNQLSDSPLTLKDIKIISATLARVLRSVFHKRIKYQENIEEIQDKANEKL